MIDADSENESTSSTTSASTSDTNTTGTTNKTSKFMNFFEVECDLENLTETLENLLTTFDHIDTNIKMVEKPIIDLPLEQFSDLKFLAASPFRQETFTVKPPGLPNIDLTKRYPYKDIVNMLRRYVFSEKLVNPDGAIRVNRTLSLLFEIPETEISFLKLLVRLRKVLV
jgi:hypothetical protein